MQITEYYLHYDLFDKEFHSQAKVEEVERKLLEEMKEAAEEIENKKPSPNRVAEVIDVMNVSLKLLRMYGILDPLHFGVIKLEQTAEKYRRAKNSFDYA